VKRRFYYFANDRVAKHGPYLSEQHARFTAQERGYTNIRVWFELVDVPRGNRSSGVSH